MFSSLKSKRTTECLSCWAPDSAVRARLVPHMLVPWASAPKLHLLVLELIYKYIYGFPYNSSRCYPCALDHTLWSCQRDAQQCASSSSVKYHCIFSYAVRVVDETDCEIAGQRVQQRMITSLSLSEDECHCLISLFNIVSHSL